MMPSFLMFHIFAALDTRSRIGVLLLGQLADDHSTVAPAFSAIWSGYARSIALRTMSMPTHCLIAFAPLRGLRSCVACRGPPARRRRAFLLAAACVGGDGVPRAVLAAPHPISVAPADADDPTPPAASPETLLELRRGLVEVGSLDLRLDLRHRPWMSAFLAARRQRVVFSFSLVTRCAASMSRVTRSSLMPTVLADDLTGGSGRRYPPASPLRRSPKPGP